MNKRIFTKSAVVVVSLFCFSAFSQWTTSGTDIYNSNSGNVGIGTANISNKLEIAGNVGINNSDIFLRGGTDQNHGLGWYGSSKLWNGFVPDGPVLYGHTGGMLGTNQFGLKKNILYWNSTGIAIGSGMSTYQGAMLTVNLSSGSNTAIAANGPVIVMNGFISAYLPGGNAGDFVGNVRVTGALSCASVKINNWTIEAPDYVFEKDYKLPSLKLVEEHIVAEKHLPGVPSAAEMKKDGVDLSQMNMTILQKVEELTLYVIEQNKKIEDLEKKVAQKY